MEDRRMTIFYVIAPDGTCERLKFATKAEADAAGPRAGSEDQCREAGHSICCRAWSESLQRWVGIPED
jgi:hypothetical protein